MKLTEAIIPNGEINWVNEIPAVAASTEKNGNVTVHNAGSPGRPSYADVKFPIHAKFEEGGVTATLSLYPAIPIVGAEKSDSVGGLEDKALLHLGPMIRAVADEVDRQMAEWEAEQAARDASGEGQAT